MAKNPRKTNASVDVNAERANSIAAKISEQVKTLVGRNWPEISKIIDDPENGNEIKLTFGILSRDRPATPGEHADSDNVLAATMGFSVKFTDKIESILPDPKQPELPTTSAEEPATE